MKALEINEKILKDSSLKGKKTTSPSFFQGSNGIYTMACLFYYNFSEDPEKEEKFDYYLGLLLKSSDLIYLEKAEDEILYGNAGYLYCLLTIANLEIGKIYNLILFL